MRWSIETWTSPNTPNQYGLAIRRLGWRERWRTRTHVRWARPTRHSIVDDAMPESKTVTFWTLHPVIAVMLFPVVLVVTLRNMVRSVQWDTHK